LPLNARVSATVQVRSDHGVRLDILPSKINGGCGELIAGRSSPRESNRLSTDTPKVSSHV
jgi:hypothetical protein